MSGPPSASDDVAEVARGSGVVFVGNLVNRALRLATNWFLSGALGAAGYGLYELARTVVTLLAALAPLGVDKGVVFFGARHLASGDGARLKGALLGSVAVAAVAGPLLSLAMAAVALALPDPATREALLVTAPAVAVWALLLVAVGALRAAREMRGQTLAYLVVLPAAMLGTAWGALALGLGLRGVLMGFVLANLLSLLMATPLALRAWRRVLAERGLRPRWELGALLRFSVPEGLSSMLFRVNQWTDTLMVGAMAGLDEVGLYRVAVSLAMLGELPAVAVNTIFQPVVAGLLVEDRSGRTREVVRVVTRWLLILAGPVYIGIIVGQDLALALFDEVYAASGAALSVLVWGQAVSVACVPAVALIPMSGRARLNLINAVVAALLNLALNALFIPRWGMTGAAAATGFTLAAWSLWRVAQVAWLMGCQPFSRRALALAALTVGLALGGRALAADAPLPAQALLTALAVTLHLALAWRFGREEGDELLLGPVRARLARRLGRSPPPSP